MNSELIDDLEILFREPQKRTRPIPLLFVHGAFAGAWVWAERFLPYFAAHGFRTAAVSLRGHGESRRQGPIDSASIADYVDDLAAAVSELDEAPVLIGHSMGGFVVQKYLEAQDSRPPVAAAALLCSVPPQGLMGSTMHMAMRFPRLLLDLNRLMGGADIDPASMRELLFFHDISLEDISRFKALMSVESQRAIWDMTMFDLVRPQAEPSLPMFVAGTDEDELVPPFLVRSTARAYGVDEQLFPGFGHAFMLEPGSERIADALIAWLTTLEN